MRLKSFTAKTSSEAMALARATLGGEAIIVATQETAGGGVRVTVAVEDEGDGEDTTLPAAAEPEETEQSGKAGEATVDRVYRALRSNAVPASVGEVLLERAGLAETTDPLLALSWALRQEFRFAPLASDRGAPRPVMLVGPPGAGKTQTAAKMAARALIGGLTVGLISIDTQRTGGLARLESFATALALDVLAAGSPEALADRLLDTADRDLVLVDSDGRSHLDGMDLADLGHFLNGNAIEPVLVIPDGVDPAEAADIAIAFAGVGATRMILTRADLARRHGGALAAAHAAGVAFGNHSTSPRIKDGLAPFDPRSLASLLLSGRVPTANASGAEPLQ